MYILSYYERVEGGGRTFLVRGQRSSLVAHWLLNAGDSGSNPVREKNFPLSFLSFDFFFVYMLTTPPQRVITKPLKLKPYPNRLVRDFVTGPKNKPFVK